MSEMCIRDFIKLTSMTPTLLFRFVSLLSCVMYIKKGLYLCLLV